MKMIFQFQKHTNALFTKDAVVKIIIIFGYPCKSRLSFRYCRKCHQEIAVVNLMSSSKKKESCGGRFHFIDPSTRKLVLTTFQSFYRLV